jgi:hypothetical protein
MLAGVAHDASAPTGRGLLHCLSAVQAGARRLWDHVLQVGTQSNDWITVYCIVQHSAYRGAHTGAFVASSHTVNLLWFSNVGRLSWGILLAATTRGGRNLWVRTIASKRIHHLYGRKRKKQRIDVKASQSNTCWLCVCVWCISWWSYWMWRRWGGCVMFVYLFQFWQ